MRHDDARPRKRRRPPLRRKTVRWSAKEVDALLAGVRVHGVGKWAAILRHSPVFNGVRTSVDLKDKWRNLTSPVRAAALNNRDHSSKSTHTPDLSNSHDHQDQPHTEPNSPNPVQDSSSQPILDSQSPHHPHDAPMSPVQSQEDVQQSLDHHTQDHNPSASKSHSNSQLAPFPPPDRDSKTVKPRPSDQSYPKSPAKLEPNLIHYVPRNPQIHPSRPPSESSVSPEVLSHPPPSSFSHSPHVVLPHTQPQSSLHMNHYMHLPQHPTSPQLPLTNLSTQQQVATLQLMNQSLYQSAAVLADYWRRVGQDPAAYGMAVSAGVPMPPHLYSYYAAKLGSLYNSDDDDDDDDDRIARILPTGWCYPHPYLHNLKKTPAVPETKDSLLRSTLPDDNVRATASQNPSGNANDEKPRKKLKTEQVPNESTGVGNDETIPSTTGAANPTVKQTPQASSSACGSGANSIVREGTDDSRCPKSNEKGSVSSRDAIKKEIVEISNTPGRETVSPEPATPASASVEVCAKPVEEPNLKSTPEQSGFDSVTDNIAYFPDEEKDTEQDGDEDGEGEMTHPMGMAPLSFPGLEVEEQRQFSVTDLV